MTSSGFFRRLLKRHNVSTVIQNFQLFSGRIPDDVVRIVIDLNFLSATAAETNATYQELRDYILTAYGLHVSNLSLDAAADRRLAAGREIRRGDFLPGSSN